MSDFEERMTISELINEMWDATLPAWLGSSAGLILLFGSGFWRFDMRPWRVLIDYGGGDIVWHQLGRNELFHGPTPPPIPMEHNIIPLCIAIIGIAIIWASNIRRNAVVRELRRRRKPALHHIR